MQSTTQGHKNGQYVIVSGWGYFLVHSFANRVLTALSVDTKRGVCVWVQYIGGGVLGREGGCDGKLVALKVQWGDERIYMEQKMGP